MVPSAPTCRRGGRWLEVLSSWAARLVDLAVELAHGTYVNAVSVNIKALEEAERLARHAGSPDLLAETLWAVAMSYNPTDPARAIAYATEAIGVCEEHGFEATEAKALGSLGLGHWDRGEMPAAIDALDRAIERADASGAVFPGLHARYLRAPALIHVGRIEDALDAAQDGFPELVRGLTALLRAEPAEAVRLISQAAATHPSPYGQIFILSHLAEAHLAAGGVARAGELATEIIETANELAISVSAACGRRLLGRARRARGELIEAETVVHAALDISQRCENNSELAEDLEALAGIPIDLDGHEDAARLFGVARSLRRTRKCP